MKKKILYICLLSLLTGCSTSKKTGTINHQNPMPVIGARGYQSKIAKVLLVASMATLADKEK